MVEVNIKNVYNDLQKLINKSLSQAEFGQALGLSPIATNKRLQRNNEIKLSELLKLQKKYNCNLLGHYVKEFNTKTADAVEIKYYNDPKVYDAVKNPLITSIWLDRELVHDIWKKKEEHLCIIQMQGDTMEGGSQPFNNNDMLIIDTNENNPLKAGVYAYTTHNNLLIFVNGLKRKLDNTIDFYYWNENYSMQNYPIKTLQEQEFQIIGRVIMNLSNLM